MPTRNLQRRAFRSSLTKISTTPTIGSRPPARARSTQYSPLTITSGTLPILYLPTFACASASFFGVASEWNAR